MKPRRIAQVTALDAPGADAHIREDVSAEPFHHRGALDARRGRGGRGQAHRSGRQRGERRAEPGDAALDFEDPYPHARIDVAFLAHHHFHGRRVVWGIRERHARVERASGCAPDETGRRELRCERGLHHSRAGRAVLERGGIVVELDQLGKLAAQAPAERADRLLAVVSQVRRDSARDDPVHHEAVAEGPGAGAQRHLAQYSALGVQHREGRVVADRSDIAQVVCDPLELGHDAAQPHGARWRPEIERTLHRLHERPRAGDRAVAREPRRDARGWLEILTGHEPFDALVGVAETLFEAHYRLAARREAKVAGLDDSGMDRTDRDLVQAWSFGGQEAIRRPLDRASWRSRSGGGWSRGGALLREGRRLGPASMIEPRPPIGQPDHLDGEQVGDRPLEAKRRRMEHGERGRSPRARLVRGDLQLAGGRLEERAVNGRCIAPFAEEIQLSFTKRFADAAPGACVDRRAGPAPMRGHRGELAEERVQHVAPTRAGSPRDGTRRRSFPAGRFRPPPRAAGAGPWVQAARRAACDAGGCRRRPGRAAAARAR